MRSGGNYGQSETCMKHCKSCDFKYPDSVTNCRACGGALTDIPAALNSHTPTALSVSSWQCTNPQCQVVFPLTDETKFCPGCATPLQIISLRPEESYSLQPVVDEVTVKKARNAKPVTEARKRSASSAKTAQISERESTPNGGSVATSPSTESSSTPNAADVASGNELAALTDSSSAHLLQNAADLSATPTESVRKKTNTPKAVWVIAFCLVFIILLTLGIVSLAGNSVEKRMDDALKRGNLVSPSGSSARDYYNQLKNENASPTTLAAYREKLMPQLTRGPQSLLDDLTTPGGRDGTLPEWEEAQKLLGWATELKPEDKSLAAKAAYAEGRTAYLKDRIEDALSAYQRAADFDKSWAPPVNSIGSMLNEHKRYSESRTYLREAIRRNPNWALPYNNMGTSYFYENNFSDAQSNYRKAVSLAPSWARPHAWLGSIAAKQKDYCAAVAEFEQALRLSTPGMSTWDPQKIQRELDIARGRCVVVNGE